MISGESAFDLTTLDTSIRFATNGSLVAYPTPANGGNGSILWQGTPSAGDSDLYDAIRCPEHNDQYRRVGFAIG